MSDDIGLLFLPSWTDRRYMASLAEISHTTAACRSRPDGSIILS